MLCTSGPKSWLNSALATTRSVGLDHRRVHVEFDPGVDSGGNPFDGIEHQVDHFVEVAARERGIQRAFDGPPTSRPRRSTG